MVVFEGTLQILEMFCMLISRPPFMNPHISLHTVVQQKVGIWKRDVIRNDTAGGFPVTYVTSICVIGMLHVNTKYLHYISRMHLDFFHQLIMF